MKIGIIGAGNCTELKLPELKSALCAADKMRAPQNRDALLAIFMAPGGNFTHEEIVAMNRAMTA